MEAHLSYVCEGSETCASIQYLPAERLVLRKFGNFFGNSCDNEEHGIDPQSVRKEITDILSMIRPREELTPVPEALSELGRKRRATDELSDLPEDELERFIGTLETEMHDAAVDLRFEYAARLRDEVKELRRELRDMRR